MQSCTLLGAYILLVEGRGVAIAQLGEVTECSNSSNTLHYDGPSKFGQKYYELSADNF